MSTVKHILILSVILTVLLFGGMFIPHFRNFYDIFGIIINKFHLSFFDTRTHNIFLAFGNALLFYFMCSVILVAIIYFIWEMVWIKMILKKYNDLKSKSDKS